MTFEEEQALEIFSNNSKDFTKIEWKEVRIGDLFEKADLKFLKKKFDKLCDVSKIKTSEFSLPLVNAKDGNNEVMYYGRECDFESTEMSIDIVGDGAVSTGNVYAQPQKTGVLYNAYLIKFKESEININKEHLLYCVTALKKAIKTKFGYENKAGWSKVKEEYITLPYINSELCFHFMETLIKALEKLVIKNVVNWESKKIKATKEVIKNKREKILG